MGILSSIQILLVMTLPFCIFSDAGVDPEAHRRDVDQWKATRLQRLTSETGWLTLCGLFWLKEGENRCGTDSANAVIFPPGKTPSYIGSIFLKGGKTSFSNATNVDVRLKDSLVTNIDLASDQTGDPTILKVGTISFYLIMRGEKLAVRVKDSENPVRMHFKGLEYFPLDPQWRFEARFEPYEPKKTLTIQSMAGTSDESVSPGALVFHHAGTDYRLDAVQDGNQLHIMFMDETNGKETYDAGRQIYIPVPDSTTVILDFNKAYNWPCVFTEFATCPIVPRQNRLKLRIEAGEKMYVGTH